MRKLSINLPRNGALSLVLLSLITKVCIDYFVFTVSPIFGIYGVEVKGDFFSGEYWLSWSLYFLVMLPFLWFISGRRDIFDYSLSFLFVSIFFPMLSFFWIAKGDLVYLLFCSVFWFSLFLMLALIPAGYRNFLSHNKGSSVEHWLGWVYLVVIVFLGVLLLINFGFSSGIGFDTVYERRNIFGEWRGGGVSAYAYTWSVYVFSIYLIFVSRRWLFKLVGIFYVFLFYAVAGDKVYLFLVGLVFFLSVVSLRGGAALLFFALIALSVSGALFFFVMGDVWVPAVVNRFLVLPIDISFNYVEYFQGGGLFYAYSFLSPFSEYQYSSLPAQLIGAQYYMDGDNANVNFLADAYVNFGWFAIVPLLLFFTVLRILLFDSRYLVLIVPLFIQAINMPLPTLLLTGGGGCMFVVAYILSKSALSRDKIRGA